MLFFNVFRKMSEVVVPGDVIGDASSYESGPGTLVCGSSIVSTLVGRRVVDGKVVSVVRGQSETSSLTPQVGDVVLLRVTRVDPKAARGKLLAIGEQPLRGEFGAMIRVQDVRLTLVDKIEM
jgi:exosome complex RNA-binding protein Csl4